VVFGYSGLGGTCWVESRRRRSGVQSVACRPQVADQASPVGRRSGTPRQRLEGRDVAPDAVHPSVEEGSRRRWKAGDHLFHGPLGSDRRCIERWGHHGARSVGFSARRRPDSAGRIGRIGRIGHIGHIGKLVIVVVV
jgi:hypothetical protein